MATIAETLAIALQYQKAGYLQAAEPLYRQVLAVDPNQARAWHLLGVLCAQLGRNDAGVDYIRRALAIQPDWVEAHYNLGKALAGQQNLEEAVASFRRAIELKPDYADSHNNLGLALQGQGKPDEAAACFRRAIELKPDFAAAHNNLGPILHGQGKADEAVACFHRALELDPGFAGAHNNLGTAALGQGKLSEAVARYRRALELKPDYADGHLNLGNAWLAQGNPDEALLCFRRILEFQPGYVVAHSNLLRTLHYRSSVTLRELAEAHAQFDQRHCAGLRATWRAHENVRDPERRLRLGFVSYDLRRHPVGYFLIRVLENLDHARCEAILYHDAPARDDLTARFKSAATAWSDVRGWTDDRLAEQIRADSVDILFDLSGHTAGNRLLVFARKPAPIQVTWLGYEGTTGLAAMDYILADRYTIPAGKETYFRERVLRMPDGYVCYDPPGEAPPVSSLPAMEKGYVTFGAFHNPAKITPQVVEVWARVLKRLPQARLVLKYLGMDDTSVAERLGGLFAGQGIDRSRLAFAPRSEFAEYFAAYSEVDIMLDAFPFGGGSTTCDALWMGVPAVTCPGETFASRHGLSHLSSVGLTETVAQDLDEYVEIAVALASDLPRLAKLRSGLRERVAVSPLCDGKRFAENFAEVLRGAWRDWCENRS